MLKSLREAPSTSESQCYLLSTATHPLILFPLQRGANAYNSPGTPDILLRVEELAQKKGVKMAQIGLAWILAKDHVTAPIIGATKFEHLTDAIGAYNFIRSCPYVC